MAWFVYILKSLRVDSKRYIGSTGDLEKRLIDHKRGGTPSTKNFIPWKIIYTETYDTKQEALHREKQLKQWKNKYRIDALIQRNMRP